MFDYKPLERKSMHFNIARLWVQKPVSSVYIEVLQANCSIGLKIISNFTKSYSIFSMNFRKEGDIPGPFILFSFIICYIFWKASYCELSKQIIIWNRCSVLQLYCKSLLRNMLSSIKFVPIQLLSFESTMSKDIKIKG